MSEVSQPIENKDENTPAAGEKAVVSPTSDNGEQSESDYVSARAYKEVSSDMHKYKSKNKDLEAKLNQLLAEREAQERSQMEEQGRWRELAEREAKARAEAEMSLQAERQKFVSANKQSAVINKLGGFKKKEYASFIDTSNIEIDDRGLPTEESVEREVNRIRQELPELLLAKSTPKLPSEAPSKETSVIVQDVRKMSVEERRAAKLATLQSKLK